MRVYPRACGGTHSGIPGQHQVEGLSPRVRGNRGIGRAAICAARSIPARAGEPIVAAGKALRSGYGNGLSPRVRGNRSRPGSQRLTYGSIPARAGEPCCEWRTGLRHRVYPRACGGTDIVAGIRDSVQGLSPRVRGNPECLRLAPLGLGSIPARAGEPLGNQTGREAHRVYPRACGGTGYTERSKPAATGLSPRVRGNPHRRPQRQHRHGSIPARAGEPRRFRRTCKRCRVYPRACGGTPMVFVHAAWQHGSIPARAGEPRRRRDSRICLRVYPRACGGTGNHGAP